MAGKAGRIMSRRAPKIIEVTSQQFDELLERAASNTLRDDDMELMRQIFASYSGFFEIVGDKNTTIARLRKLLFGATTEKAKDVLGDAEATPNVPDGDTSNDSSDAGDASGGTANANSDVSGNNEADSSSETTPGHGRLGADDYPALTRSMSVIRNFRQAIRVLIAFRERFTKNHPVCWFALKGRHLCTRLCIACRSCVATFVENCLRHQVPLALAMTSSTTPWPA